MRCDLPQICLKSAWEEAEDPTAQPSPLSSEVINNRFNNNSIMNLMVTVWIVLYVLRQKDLQVTYATFRLCSTQQQVRIISSERRMKPYRTSVLMG